MDNLTHGLLGAAIGMLRPRDGGPERDAPPTPTDRAVVWASVMAAEMPDLDVFLGGGPMAGYQYHRGLSHAFITAPAVALVASSVVSLLWRKARFGTVYLWSLLSVLVAHLVNDLMTGWGTRVLLPWSEARLASDWVPIVDLLYTLPLLLGVLLAYRRPLLRGKAIAGVLLYLLVYTCGYRAAAHTLVERATREAYAAEEVQRLQVSPDMLNPLAWQFTVDLGDRFEQGRAYPFGAVRAAQITVKTPPDQVTRALQQAPELAPFFAQFHFVQIEYRQVPDGYLATIGDVRYRWRGAGMVYRVSLNRDLKVTRIEEGGL